MSMSVPVARVSLADLRARRIQQGDLVKVGEYLPRKVDAALRRFADAKGLVADGDDTFCAAIVIAMLDAGLTRRMSEAVIYFKKDDDLVEVPLEAFYSFMEIEFGVGVGELVPRRLLKHRRLQAAFAETLMIVRDEGGDALNRAIQGYVTMSNAKDRLVSIEQAQAYEDILD